MKILRQNTEIIYKKQSSKRKQLPFRNRKRDTELKDREIRIRNEIKELFFKTDCCVYRSYG